MHHAPFLTLTVFVFPFKTRKQGLPTCLSYTATAVPSIYLKLVQNSRHTRVRCYLQLFSVHWNVTGVCLES